VSDLVDAILLRDDNGGSGGRNGDAHAAGSIEQQRSLSSRDAMSGLLLLLRRRAVQADSLSARLGVERHKQLLARLYLQFEDPATDVTLAVSPHMRFSSSFINLARNVVKAGTSLMMLSFLRGCVLFFLPFVQRTCAQLLLRIDSRWYTFVRDKDLPGVLADDNTPALARERALRLVSDNIIRTCSAAHGMHPICADILVFVPHRLLTCVLLSFVFCHC
jgi:hypothetical protein